MNITYIQPELKTRKSEFFNIRSSFNAPNLMSQIMKPSVSDGVLVPTFCIRCFLDVTDSMMPRSRGRNLTDDSQGKAETINNSY